MARVIQTESVLDAAFAGVSRVAEFIVSLPEEDWQQALTAAEQSYFKTARELGYSEEQALGWASSLLTKVQSEIDRYAQGIVDAA